MDGIRLWNGRDGIRLWYGRDGIRLCYERDGWLCKCFPTFKIKNPFIKVPICSTYFSKLSRYIFLNIRKQSVIKNNSESKNSSLST